ncbi:MAG: SET domain-containing protein-lysine N-methyltransferase [Vicinamibacterales bacterium]
MIVDESDPRFYVAPSMIPGAGQGLFARVPLPAGERLAVTGMRVIRGSASDLCTAFADEYKFRVGDDLLIPCGLAAMANHSSQPNLHKVVVAEALFLELTRAVMAGEELCFAYSEYARERYRIR